MCLRLPTLDDAPDLELMGGKAYALACLRQAEFRVPPGLVVPPDSGSGHADDVELSGEVVRALMEGLKVLSPDPRARFAVRSSALEEDGDRASFAGQLDSYLEVAVEDVPARVVKVRQSLSSERLQFYRKQNQLPPPGRPPAVLVQVMVDAESAGVAFSADPVSGRRGLAVISAVRGHGERLVSGAADAETWQVDREGEALRQSPGEEAVLSPETVVEVAELARSCAGFWGCPQDVEWALADGELHLLQSRPITTLRGMADPDGAPALWDNSNIAESYGGVTTPLTFSFAHYIYTEVYQQFCLLMHVPRREVASRREVFGNLLGLIRGRVYYNLLSWYRMLSLLPGFHLNRKFMEQMMGVKEPLPPDILQQVKVRPAAGALRERVRLLWALTGLVRAHTGLSRMTRRFYRHFEETLSALPAPLETLRADELARHFRELEGRLLTRWDAPLVNDFFAMIYFGLLRSLTRKWCGDEAGTLQNGLLCGSGNIVSAEPARRIHAMARLAVGSPELVEALQSEGVVALLRRLARHPEFQEAYRDYLDRFADRCLNELKLESSTLRDDPLPLLRSVGGMARRLQSGHEPATNSERELAAAAEAQVRACLRLRPLRRLCFRLVLRQTRRRVRARENLRFERTRLFGRIRLLFVELGKRLSAEEALEDPRDIFYLTVGEALGYVEGTATTADLKALVRLRRAEFGGYQREAPPDRFLTRGMVYAGTILSPETETPPTEEAEDPGLRGLGCCPGVVAGRARVVRDPRGAELREGEILVAEQTDPGWITLFPAAAAVLVERGSLLSHSAIVSREMGIPAIVSVKGLLRRVRTGDLLRIDGTTGVINILEGRHDEAGD